MYKEIEGDLIALAKKGSFDVICHGANCLSNMGAGLAPQMAKTFGCDKFEMETWGPTIDKLGNIDYETFVLGKNAIWSLNDADNKLDEPELTVINAYTQYRYGRNHIDGDKVPFDYDAFAVICKKLNHIFKGKHIGLPKIGCGLAGALWVTVKGIIRKELKDCEVTVVIYKP